MVRMTERAKVLPAEAQLGAQLDPNLMVHVYGRSTTARDAAKGMSSDVGAAQRSPLGIIATLCC
jgi:hypothetical protein